MPSEGPPSAVPVPEALVAKVRNELTEVRMGVYLASVRLADGTLIEPVVINSRPNFIGRAVSPRLDMEPVGFDSEDVVDLVDASDWNRW